MKILTIVESLGLGGTERVAQNFSTGYQKFNCQSKVLATKEMGIRANHLTNENIEIFDGSKNLIHSLKAINIWKPDIIHIHRPGYFNEMNGILASIKLENTKVIETNVFARPDYSESAHLVDIHLNLTNWCFWKWKHWTKGLNQMGAIIPNLIDCSKFKETDNAIKHIKLRSLNPEAIILGRVGQPIPSKWNKIIFEVLQELLKINDKYYLVVVGLPEILKDILSTYDINFQNHVLVIDTINNDEELNGLYKQFDIFLHASAIGESFGMVLAEAHLNKVPIITLNTPLKDNSQNEIVGHNKGGYVVSDKKNMIKAIEILAKDKELRKKFGQTGFENISKSFELNLVTEKALNLCEVLLKNKSRKKIILELEKLNIATNIEDSKIKDLNENVMGGFSLTDKLLLKILHNPKFYKNYLKFKNNI